MRARDHRVGRDAQADRLVAQVGRADQEVADQGALLGAPQISVEQDPLRRQLALVREAQALARITQPNVLTVYDVGSFGDSVFLAAELVDGDTLDVWLAWPRRWRSIVEVFVQAARGLEAAHAAGLVHRDFKPSNVLVGHDGRVRVFDFGLVRFTEVAAAGREIAGTPIYMAPEQRRGEVADARADQYAFCVALHEALLGARPAPGAATARPVPAAVDRVSGWLRDVVRRGLAPEPVARFPSMRALITRLERGLNRRRRAVQIGLGGVAVTAAVVTAGLGYVRGRDEPLARCSELAASATWDAARKAQLAAAFSTTGLAYASTTATRVEHDLDRFVTGWRRQRREACLAVEPGRAASRELHDRRVGCLDRQWIMFEALVDRFAHADRQVVNQVARLIGAVPDPEACTHPRDMAWPVDPDARARFTAHVEEAAAVASLAEAGQFDAAASRVDALVHDADTLGFRPAQADATYLAGHVAGFQARYHQAVELVEAALWTAEAARYDALVVTAACELIHLIGSRQRRPAEARRFVELARAAAERVGSVSARARAARAIGTLELVAGRFEAAEAELGRASLLSLAALALRRHDLRAAADLCAQARRSVRGSDANNRAILALVETCRGEVELAAGRSARAAAIFEHALELHAGGEDPGRLGDTQFALARALPATSRGRAVELARHARAAFEREKAYRADDVAAVDAWLRSARAR